MKINGYTGLYGIVADPIKHSLSPLMHNSAFEYLGMNDVYLAFEVSPLDFKYFIQSIKPLHMKGFNVSMPYKETIVGYMDELTNQAQLCQAVNTVKNENGHLIGHITDGEGFVLACQSKGWQLEDQKIVILGAGGAAIAIVVSLAILGVKEIVVYNRSDSTKMVELSQKLDTPIRFHTLSNNELLKEDLKDAYLLVQATSVGMNDDCLIDGSYLNSSLKVVDIIYKPYQTKLLNYCQQLGIEYMNGIGMLIYQGAAAFKFWTDKDMPINIIKEKIEEEIIK